MANEVEVLLKGKDVSASSTFKSAEGSAKSYGSSLEGVGEKADSSETRLLGLKDGVDGVATIMQGPGQAGMAAYIQGWADLASGIANFAIPALMSVATASGRAAIATAASTAAQTAAAAGAKAWAAAQWVLNAALSANPIGLVIIAIAALVAGIIIAYKKSETFRNIVQAAFRGIQAAAQALVRGFKAAMDGIARAATATWNAIKRGASALVSGIKMYASAITAPYRAAFAGIRAAWNSTVGGKGFSVPGWIPGVGGKSFRIPYLATGGIASGLAIVGERGAEMVNLGAGSKVSPASNTAGALAQSQQNSSPIIVQNMLDGKVISEVIIDPLRRTIKKRGGNVQTVLGA